MSQSCQRCNKTYNGPEAFLLTCRGCRKTWHHRCLMPPMEDQHLIQLIRATNAGDTTNSLKSWTCRRCKKHGSQTPSVVSSREQTASSEDNNSWSSSRSPAIGDSTSVTSVSSTADACVKQESSNPLLVHDREQSERSDRHEPTESAPVKHTFASKRPKSSPTNELHVQSRPGSSKLGNDNVQMAGITPTRFPPQRSSPLTHSCPVRAARKLGDTVSTTSSEDDVEMQVDPPFSERTLGAAIATRERKEQARPAVGAAIQSQVSQIAAAEIQDDPEDLYGPPVEHRIIRILPALAEELREQQRRVNVEKKKRDVPLAPDWILARHSNDPLWKKIPATKGRRRGKPTAGKLGENGLNVDELMSCFTIQSWVREHKEQT